MQQKAPQRGDIILCFGSEDTVGGICPLVRDQVWKANTATMCFNLKQHYRSFSRRRTGLRGQCASNDVLVSTLNSTSDPVICPTLEIRSASDNSSRKASSFVIVQKSKELKLLRYFILSTTISVTSRVYKPVQHDGYLSEETTQKSVPLLLSLSVQYLISVMFDLLVSWRSQTTCCTDYKLTLHLTLKCELIKSFYFQQHENNPMYIKGNFTRS